jgi:hypothetical protein
VTNFDAEYQATARSAGGCTVYLTQNRESYGRVLKNMNAVDSLLGNLQCKFFCQNTGQTNDWASFILGQRWVKMTSTSAGQSQNEATPKNPDEQLSSNSRGRMTKYNYNRELPTNTVLEFLRKQLPEQYELAEVVGKWVWLEFPKASHRAAANTLYRLGFHWNSRRCVWQHPCGACAPYASHPKDPRSKYRSYFAADVLPA